jgi:HAD superfamily hydrolase (TIGR01509 family)
VAVKAATFDIGGVIYSDDVFKKAIFQALIELGATVEVAEFNRIYEDHLKSQTGSLRSKLCTEFFGNLDKKSELMTAATKHWIFTEADLYPEALNTIKKLTDAGLKIGLVANQPTSVVGSLKRDGIFDFIKYAGISALVGVEKPDPKIFELALEGLGVSASETIHIGNRIDTDVLPAKKLGFKTIWVRRGEANPEPSAADLAEPTFFVDDLSTVPALIASL